MPAVNMLLDGGVAPMMAQNPSGSVVTGGGGSAPKASLGNIGGALSVGKPGGNEPTILATLVLGAAAVILIIHIAGVRANFTLAAGR